MEEVMKEEAFIREKLPQVNDCLRQCKSLANMMVKTFKHWIEIKFELNSLEGGLNNKKEINGKEFP